MNVFGTITGFSLIAFGIRNAGDDLIILAAFEILIGCALLLIYGSRLLDGARK